MPHATPSPGPRSTWPKTPNFHRPPGAPWPRGMPLPPQPAPATLAQMRTNDRLLYGSDANALNTARFKENLQPILDMDVSDEIKNKILCETAKKLLKI